VKYLHLIWSNLKRKKLRTLLTLLSVVVAFILFGYLSAIKQALAGGISLAGQNRLWVVHKMSIIQSLPQSYKARIERIPGVALATHETWFGGIYQDSKNIFPQIPVIPEEFLEMVPELILPPEQKQAWLQSRTGAIVGRKTADRFHWKVGDRIPLQSSIWTKTDGSRLWEFDIVGIFDGRDKNTDLTPLYFRYDYFDEARQWNKGQVGWYLVRLKDPDQAPEVARLIDQEFENSDAETKAQPEAAFVQAWLKQIGDITLITSTIMSAVFFTILLVTGNTMSQSVRERTGELGVLKALGFTSVQALSLVLAESCLLAVLGGGLGLGLALILIAPGDPTGGLLPMFFFPARDVLVGVGISVALGLLAGVFPALQAMRLRVADALRRM
jgi:putative ABC transport system permease protein